MRLLKYSVYLSLIIMLPILFSSCSKMPPVYCDSRMFYMDTLIDMRLAKTSSVSDKEISEVEKKCAEIISDIEEKISRTNPESDTASFNSDIDMMLEPDEVFENILETALKISDMTDGAYDPTVGILTDLWDIKNASAPPAPQKITEALSHVGWDKVEITDEGVSKKDSQLSIDLGGIGKGYAAQKVLEYLESTDIEYGLISMGGNVGVFGKKTDGTPFKIGIRDPDDSKAVAGYVTLDSGFVAVSGDYERYMISDGVRYHHIFDPKIGYPASSGLRSVAVICNNGSAADAFSTALFVMGVDKSLEFYKTSPIKFEAVFITDKNEIILTDGLKNESRFELYGDKFTLADK